MEDTVFVPAEDARSDAFSDVPRRRLRDLVARQGPSLMNSPNAEARLRAVCHGYDREAPLLVAALRAEIPARILAAPAMPTSILSDDIAEQRRIDPKAAAWAVESWAYALDGTPATLTMLRERAAPLSLAVSGDAVFSRMPIAVEQRMLIPDHAPAAPPNVKLEIWPPGPGVTVSMIENTSGTDGPLPREVAAKSWHWGACALSGIWLLFHKNPLLGGIALLMNFVPLIGGLVGLAIALYCGANGYKIAWHARRFESVDEFFTVQNRWSLWATITTLAMTVLIGGAAVWYVQSLQGSLSPLIP